VSLSSKSYLSQEVHWKILSLDLEILNHLVVVETDRKEEERDEEERE
jgi:hypothetical protein